jgi:hypothetical protein
MQELKKIHRCDQTAGIADAAAAYRSCNANEHGLFSCACYRAAESHSRAPPYSGHPDGGGNRVQITGKSGMRRGGFRKNLSFSITSRIARLSREGASYRRVVLPGTPPAALTLCPSVGMIEACMHRVSTRSICYNVFHQVVLQVPASPAALTPCLLPLTWLAHDRSCMQFIARTSRVSQRGMVEHFRRDTLRLRVHIEIVCTVRRCSGANLYWAIRTGISLCDTRRAVCAAVHLLLVRLRSTKL